MMTSGDHSKVVGAGMIALDLVIGSDPEAPVRSWAGGTCGNVLSIGLWLISGGMLTRSRV